MKSPHFLHRWKYLDSEHRICAACGECQYLYAPTQGWFKGPDSNQLEYIADPGTFWKTCLADELERHMAETRDRIEQQASKQNASQARAFELLKANEPGRVLKFCKSCGSKNQVEANFCVACGRQLPARP